jgi:hypothetical protein
MLEEMEDLTFEEAKDEEEDTGDHLEESDGLCLLTAK